VCDVFFEAEFGGFLDEVPAVDAGGDVLEAGVDVVAELFELGLKVGGEGVVGAAADAEFDGVEGVVEGEAELVEERESFEGFAGAGGLVSGGGEELVVGGDAGFDIAAELVEVAVGGSAEAFHDGGEELSHEQVLLGEGVSEACAGAGGENEGGDDEGDDDAEENFQDAMEGENPAGASVVDEHEDADGDAGEAGAVFESE